MITEYLTYRPPRRTSSAPRRPRRKAFLHRIRKLPPPTGLGVFPDRSHVRIVVRADVHKVRDEELERCIVVNRVVRDVVFCKGGEDAGPRSAGCVDGFVFGFGGRLELDR
jgi:hypothetical protein